LLDCSGCRRNYRICVIYILKSAEAKRLQKDGDRVMFDALINAVCPCVQEDENGDL
jgi:hypothetical protein